MALTKEQQDLASLLNSILTQWGIEGLSQFIIDAVVAGKDQLTIVTELRQTPQYKARFPAMETLQKKAAAGTGVAITEAQYLEMEQSYRQAFQSSGLPPTMWDTPDDFRRLIEADVSPVEVQRRIGAAREAVDSTDPAVRDALAKMYGITTTDLMAYALDPEKNADYIQKIAMTARLAGYAGTAGIIGNVNRQQWESYAQDLINQQISDADLRNLISGADIMAEAQSRLAGIEGDQFTTTDALDIAIRKDSNKMLKSEQRVARERARFSVTQGVSTGTLKGSGI